MVGIGLQSGKIILHNLKFDETVMSFHQEWGPVIGLTFRTGMRLVRPFSQLFLFPIAFPFVIAGDKWLTKWKIGTVIKRERKKEELKEGVWVYEKPTGICWFSIFFLYPACDMMYRLQVRVIAVWMILQSLDLLLLWYDAENVFLFNFARMSQLSNGKENTWRIRPS